MASFQHGPTITVPFMFKGGMGGGFVWKVRCCIISFVLTPLILVLFSSVHLTTLSEASCILDSAGLSMVSVTVEYSMNQCLYNTPI